MRLVTLALIALIALVHAELWFGKGSVPRVMELQAKLREQQATNDSARTRNEQLVAEVSDLKEGLEMVEEKARFELGMVKPDEILVQVTVPRK
ncbi:MAG TPA: cell division protein FtsB [Albitalea sp.]|nr:cell division protein FtsB [Albitalea sp.]HJW11604.1 cell division protein FtsB [Albitalea sp.]